MALITQAEFGKLMGVTRQRVNQWVSEGVIELVRVPGKKRGFVDEEKAKAAVNAARDHSRRRIVNVEQKKEVPGKSMFDEDVLPEKSLADMSPAERAVYNRNLENERRRLQQVRQQAKESGIDVDSIDGGKIPASLNKVKIFKELYQGKLAKLDFERKSGNLLPAEIVKSDGFEAGRLMRDSLLNIPHKISVRLVNIQDPKEIEAMIENEIREALENVSFGY